MDNQRGNAIVAVFFLILPLSVAMGITGLFGGSLAPFFPDIDYWKGFWYFNLIAGTGWLLQLLLATVILKSEIRADYIGYLLTVVMSVGLLLLVPYILLTFVISSFPIWLPLIFIIGSFLIMLYRHYVKVDFLDIPQWWTVSWVLCLWVPSFIIANFLVF